MDIFESIDNLVTNSTDLPKTHREKLLIYSEGLKSKLKQNHFALQQIQQLATRDNTSTSGEILDTSEEVSFYCDCFWVFLYSCLDILSQVINIKHNLSINEQQVSFNDIHSRRNDLPTNLSVAIDNLKKSNVYKNANKYRNCSLHRRHIALKCETRSTTVSAGYTIAGASITGTVNVRQICDNPYKLKPNFTQKRKIDDYCDKARKDVIRRIRKIIQTL